MNSDVFVSFRGIDTRKTFVSHLLLALLKKRISVFKHEEEIPGKQPPSYRVLWAIQVSKIAIAVISKNYAASIRCLDELAKIIECKEKGSLVVVPVFYEVDPSDVIRQVDDHVNHGDGDNQLEKVKRWSDALAKSIQIYEQDFSFWEVEESYSHILDRVMIYITQCLSETTLSTPSWGHMPLAEFAMPCSGSTHQLACSLGSTFHSADPMPQGRFVTAGSGSTPLSTKPRPAWSFADVQKDNYVTGDNLSRLVISNDFNSFVGMDRLMKAVETLLDLESRDRILEIGIWAEIVGLGRTTLARCVYKHISRQFQDHHYFVKDTKNCSLGTCVLEDITRAALTQESESLDEVVKAKLGHRKVLLIVDDLDDIDHFENIRNVSLWFGPGSRLIFVTEGKDLLLHCGVERLYEVEPLRFEEALQLFSQFSFKQEHIPREYHQLSFRAVLLTGRIPLALKVFGSFLRGKSISEWERELCRLEASQDNYITKLSNDFVNHLS